jgi:hypothetical protein
VKRSTRKELAEETVSITRRGSYETAPGRVVDLRDAIASCLSATRFVSAADVGELRDAETKAAIAGPAAVIEVVSETTLAGIARVLG